jgi:aminoglycoside/choline kinase family phosphotransferase
MREPIIQLFESHFGVPPVSVREIGADGSNRTYIRLLGPAEERAIGGVGPDPEENRAFFSFTRTLRGAGFPVPELYAVEESAGVWLEEDLGDVTLFDALSEAREREPQGFPASMVPAYKKILSLLPRLQVEGGRLIDFSVAYPRSAFDQQSIRWDLNYFKYHFLKLAHVPFNEQKLENDFDVLTAFLLAADTTHFLYRDFQSRNIMLRDGEPWLIDYQGGRRGALQYDVASLLYDAKAALPEPLRSELLEHYMEALETELPVDQTAFRERYRGYVVVRMLQAMGAYGYRGFHEGKPRFLQSVPHAARNLEIVLEQGLPVTAPELERVFRRIVDRWAEWSPGEGEDGLTVRITSFSYRAGYPREPDPHGGGFVFDCRALPNPGRHAEYEQRTGLDPSVAAFLDERDEARSFWRGVRQLTDAQVEEYLRRGFSSLAVSFGCTGGQHRSVYMAERLADHLREAFPQVKVRVMHREEEHWPTPGAD